jgi:hypothetical protein
MKNNLALLLVGLTLMLAPLSAADDLANEESPASLLTNLFPAPPHLALSGTQFGELISSMDAGPREQAILHQILEGNVPSFLKNLVPVRLTYEPAAGQTVHVTVFVMPDYLSIGNNKDFLRIPMNLKTAAAVALRTGFLLPTKKIVDAIYAQSAFHYSPEPMLAGPMMRSTAYYRVHNEKIQEQGKALGIPEGALVSGHKKDVVMTNLLANNPGRIAIYGWHRLNGQAIQPLSTVHGVCYADYSHGIRLVSETALVDGRKRSLYDLLNDPQFAKAISYEGLIPHLKAMISQFAESTFCK